MNTIRELLAAATLKREQVDRFLDPESHNWAQFDSELGYTLKSSLIRDGVDGSFTIGRYPVTGERQMVNFAHRPCRINTYGDSFTQCHQVSDGETWQETLAAHFGEPVRNFGVGGYGVYQAYRRMLRHEATDQAAPYIILNIWGDDHHRSLMAWRWISLARWPGRRNPAMFHANPWSHVRIDLGTLKLVEKPNPYPTPESLYQLCDEEHVYEAFQDDLVVQIMVAQQPGSDLDVFQLEETASALGLRLDFRDPETRPGAASTLYNACAWLASELIVEKAREYCAGQGKNLMVLLSYPGGDVVNACRADSEGRGDYTGCHGPRFREYLARTGLLVVDSMPKHVEEFRTFRLDPREYANRYYIGHYNPTGNHFFAHAIKDELIAWLDPKPITYQEEGAVIRFKEYLPE
jgi:hypothetical protein